MSFADAQPPPAKKRRFFVETSPITEKKFVSAPLPASKDDDDDDGGEGPLSEGSLDDHVSGDVLPPRESSGGRRKDGAKAETTSGSPSAFDAAVFESITGVSLDADSMKRLREVAGDNMERGR
jgi:hypothetical protein